MFTPVALVILLQAATIMFIAANKNSNNVQVCRSPARLSLSF